MAFKIDGFNERMNYIKNSNNIREKKSNFDNSFAKMRSEERKNIVTTSNLDNSSNYYQVKGNKENFVIRNNALNNVNHKNLERDPVREALNKNIFKK